MKFEGIWFNLDREICRDEVEARDANEASSLIHSKYYGREEPGEALAIVPKEIKGKNDLSGYYNTTWR